MEGLLLSGKSLDRSADNIFLNLIRTAKVVCNRRCLLIMEDDRNSKCATASWARTLSFFIAMASAALLLLCLWRWVRGHGHREELLTPLALFLLTLPHAIRIEGVLRPVVQFIGLAIMILAIVMLSRSLGS